MHWNGACRSGCLERSATALILSDDDDWMRCGFVNLNVRGCKTCEFSPTGSCEEPDAEEFEQLVKVWCDVLNVATCQRCLSGF